MAIEDRDSDQQGLLPAQKASRLSDRMIPDVRDPANKVLLEGIGEYERSKAQDNSLRGFINTMAATRDTYNYLATALNTNPPRRLVFLGGLDKYAHEIDIQRLNDEITVLDTIPNLPLYHKFTLLFQAVWDRVSNYTTAENLFAISDRTRQTCLNWVKDKKTIIDYERFTNLVKHYQANPEGFIHSLDSLHNLLLALPDNLLAKQALLRKRNETFSERDTTGRVGLMIRIIDDMKDLSIQDKLRFFFAYYNQVFRSDFGEQAPPIHNLLALLTATRPIDSFPLQFPLLKPPEQNRLFNANQRAGVMADLMRQRQNIQDIEDIYTEFYHWVRETLLNNENNLLGWNDLGRLNIPSELRMLSPRDAGDKIRLASLELVKRGLLPIKTLYGEEITPANRERIRWYERVTRLQNYLTQHKGENITMGILAQEIDCSERTTQVILSKMRKREIGLPPEKKVIPDNFKISHATKADALIIAINTLIDNLASQQQVSSNQISLTDEEILTLLKQSDEWKNLKMEILRVVLYHPQNRQRTKLARRIAPDITPQQIQQAIQLRAANPQLTNNEIAQIVGATKDGVRKALKRAKNQSSSQS